MSGRGVIAVACLALAGGCKKKAAPAAAPVAAKAAVDAYACPAGEKIAGLLAAPGRKVQTSCLAFPMGRYWIAAALAVEEKGEPRLSLLSGGSYQPLVYDLEAVPGAALAQLLKRGGPVEVRLVKPHADGHLLRVGVVARAAGGGPASEELALVLQMVAHKPPRVLWVGEGDQVKVEGGCVSEQAVGFEMPFGTRLEVVRSLRARPLEAGGKLPAGCASSPGTQEPADFKPVSLKPPRVLEGVQPI